MDFNALTTAVEWSVKKMETARANRKDAIKEYVGMHYSENGSDVRVPTNFIELAVTIYVRLLAARAPRCLVGAKLVNLRPFAADMELALNEIPDEIDLSDTIRRAVVEALFSMGVVKVGVAPNGREVDGVPYAEPFVDIVQLDDYFCDMSARSWKEIQFEGNSYWMDLEDARAMFHDPDLGPDEDDGGSDTGAESAHSISANETAVPIRERIRMRDVYLTRERRLVTYAVDLNRKLRDIPWDGPEGTPYIRLSFEDVPGNLLPLPPVALWRDLHELGNSLFRKLAREGDEKKSVHVFRGGNDDDVVRFQNARDGDGIRFNGASMETMTTPGPDQMTLAFFLQTRDIFNILAGNLDSLGGLSPQTDTATQDRLLNEAASSRVRAMAEATTDFARAIFRRLAWYLWTDPVRTSRMMKMADERRGIGVVVEWTPETRDGDFLDYNFDIDVFSMQDDTPQMKVEKFGLVFERFLLPMMQDIQAQGGYFDAKEIVEFLSKNGNLPELTGFVKFAEPYAGDQRMPAGNPQPDYVSVKPAVTRRVYERVNRPGATRAGKDYAMSQLLMGGRPQADEAAAMGRDVG